MSKKKKWIVSLVEGEPIIKKRGKYKWHVQKFYITVGLYKHPKARASLIINAIQASAAARKYIKYNLPSTLLEMEEPGHYDGEEIGKELKKDKGWLERHYMEFDSKGQIRVEKLSNVPD